MQSVTTGAPLRLTRDQQAILSAGQRLVAMKTHTKPFDVEHLTLYQLLNLAHFKLDVPAYQRPFEWKEQDVLGLLKDVKKTFEAVAPEDYLLLGSVQLRGEVAERSSPVRNCEVVDGQQRLATLMLLYSALYQKRSRARSAT